MTITKIRFDGAAYVPERDDIRLTAQLGRVWEAMRGGAWRTLRQLADTTGDPEASISAQLRHLRKDRFGGHTVERDYVGNGVYAYRLIPNPAAAAAGAESGDLFKDAA